MTLDSRWGLPARILAGALILAYAAASTGCYRWRAVPVSELSLAKERIESRRVRFFTPDGTVTLTVQGVAFPYVIGVPDVDTGLVEFDVRTARAAEIVEQGGARTTPITEASLASGAMLTQTVRFATPSGRVVLVVEKVQYPWVVGRPRQSDGVVRFDVRGAQRMEVRGLDGVKTALATVGIAAGAFATIVLIVLLTKESCPFVYVDRGDGLELVGEAYAGAAFASIQRDDLLPLPPFEKGPVRVQLRNEARETQYTDSVELVVADHPPGTRVLSTFDNHPMLVGSAVPPTTARNVDGRDVTAAVTAKDETLWETNVPAVAAGRNGQLSDALEAAFDIRGGGQRVLEIVGSNTPWLDLVFGRFFASMGGRLNRYVAAGNDATAGDRIMRWKKREGIDLTVEIAQGDKWQVVAMVPTVGPVALREIAIPLPAVADRQNVVRVRLRGGLGFWRIDRLALSTRLDSAIEVRRVRPATARGTGGRNEEDAVAAVDRRYHVLELLNERLDLMFDVPPVPPGRTRSFFLFTNGYYNVHPPVQSSWSPATLKAIRDEPGAFSRFSRDLAREYVRIANGPHAVANENR